MSSETEKVTEAAAMAAAEPSEKAVSPAAATASKSAEGEDAKQAVVAAGSETKARGPVAEDEGASKKQTDSPSTAASSNTTSTGPPPPASTSKSSTTTAPAGGEMKQNADASSKGKAAVAPPAPAGQSKSSETTPSTLTSENTASSSSSGLDPASTEQSEPKSSEAEPKMETFHMNVAGAGPSGVRGEAFRHKFLQKLSYERIWVPAAQRPPQHQTVIIFDWDDTLLCTSFLNLRLPTPEIPGHVQRQLLLLERVGAQLLELAMKLGQTFIITNAMKGWVEYSASKYVPRLLPTLQKIQIISARGNYEHAFPGNYGQWKIEAFLEVQRQLNSQIITNLISLGDSNMEMEAVHVMGKEFAQALIKTIKFRESPTPEELVKQLELVGQKFEKIILNARNLKIGLERKWNGDKSRSSKERSSGHHQHHPPGAAAGAAPSGGGPSAGAGGRAPASSENTSTATGGTALHQAMLRDQQQQQQSTNATSTFQPPGRSSPALTPERLAAMDARNASSSGNQEASGEASGAATSSLGAPATSEVTTATPAAQSIASATAGATASTTPKEIKHSSETGAPDTTSLPPDSSSVYEGSDFGAGSEPASPRGPVLGPEEKNEVLKKANFSASVLADVAAASSTSASTAPSPSDPDGDAAA
ncbi:unnamed protein product [Amoebophrya sp. A25]|nr:unnamed protein product [Amoebophrya sp. A25]|eukprot:GSA25T00013506001.1